MISGSWRRSLLDVKVKRGADVGSDHHLVTAALRLKLRRSGPKPTGQKRYDIEKLRDPKTRSSFVLQLRNRFQALADAEQQESSDVSKKWERVQHAYLQVSETCLGVQQKKRREWITADTWQAVEHRRGLKKKVMDTKSERLKEQYKKQYRETDKVVKKKTRADRRAFMDDLASQAEDAASRGEQGKVYKITKIAVIPLSEEEPLELELEVC